MADSRSKRFAAFRKRAVRFVRSWYFPAALSLILLAGCVYWLVPRRVTTVVTVDGRHEWKSEDAPARRQFVWKPAEAVQAVQDGTAERPEFAKASLIRPQLTDAGATLYFTLRQSDGNADIYRSRLIDGRWESPKPVAEFNTPSADIGPGISANGQEAYFYSNRPGGYGGFDLYVSRREEAGWGEPKNLGPHINTPAHEYDPALSPDGERLYFASNRTKKMRERIANMIAVDAAKDWDATLRAQPGMGHFDLYSSRREAEGKTWAAALPVAKVNRADSNEGAPTISPNGIFLYFASDRAGGRGGYDLYRARLRDGEASGVENLGASVNTAANEMEPAVSPEGFTLLFSSDRDAPGERYVLFESRAIEVTEESEWDDANWRAFVAVWKDVWLWALLATLALLALFLLWRRYSGELSEKTLAARFVLSSVAVHLLILLLAAFVTIGKAIIETRDGDREVVVAAKVTDSALHESHEKGLEAFEKLADLKAVEQAAIPVKRRQVREAQNIPHKSRKLRPTIPADMIKQLPPDRVIIEPKPAEPGPRKLQRHRRPLDNRVVRLDAKKLELPKNDEPRERPVDNQPNSLPRKLAAAKPTPAPRGMNVPRKIPGGLGKPIVQVKETVARPVTRPKARSLAKRTIRNATPAKPQPSGKEPDKLTVTPEKKEAPVGPATTPANQRDNALVKQPNTSRQRPMFDDPPLQPGATSGMPAKKLSPKAGPKSGTGFKLARNKAFKPRPAGVNDDAAGELPAENDGRKLGQLSPQPEAPEGRSRPKLKAKVRTPPRPSGPRNVLNRKTIIGQLAKKDVPAPPAFNRRASLLQRKLAKAAPVAYARESVGVKKMFALRKPDVHKTILPLLGASKESEQAVDRGLHWIARHQLPDGRWSLNEFNKACKGHKKCSGHGKVDSDTAATGFALLPFLGRGQSHQKGEYQTVIDRGLKWLIKHQKKNGDLYTGGGGNAYMYSHGIATIALCEAYGVSGDPQLKRPAQKAIDFIVAAQHTGSGGWRYKPRQRGDTSVVGWQVMALKSGEMAGLKVPPKTLELAGKWLDSVEGRGKQRGRYGYSNRGGTPAMTAEALLCRQFLGTPRDDPGMIAGGDYLTGHPPRHGQLTSYYWYYGMQVMYHLQGEHWKAWNEPTRKMLETSQVTKGPMAGTWNPRDRWEQQAGRLYATSLRLLILEVYYRHLPLYRQLGR